MRTVRDNRDIQAASMVVSNLFRTIHNDPKADADQYHHVMQAMISLRRAMPRTISGKHDGWTDHVKMTRYESNR